MACEGRWGGARKGRKGRNDIEDRKFEGKGGEESLMKCKREGKGRDGSERERRKKEI